MKWKNRLTNYNFWISIVSAVLLILQAFKFQFDIAYINEIATAVLGLLVVIGIISDPTKTYASEQLTKHEPKKENVVDAKSSEENKTAEAITLPIQVETENSNGDVKDDFKVVIDKISADINENLAKINEIQNSILKEINASLTTTQQKVEGEIVDSSTNENKEEITCLSIVNN